MAGGGPAAHPGPFRPHVRPAAGCGDPRHRRPRSGRPCSGGSCSGGSCSGRPCSGGSRIRGPAMEPPPVGHPHRAVRRAVPRRARRVDGRVALPAIRASPGLTTSPLQWIVSGYVLGYGGLLLSGGRAADLLGRRRVFLAALALFAVAALLAAFAVIERRSAGPLVRLGIFRSGALTRANIGAVTLSGSYVAFQFLLTQYLQTLSGWSALSTALAFLPAGVIVAVLSTRMGALAG